jgi:chromosome partitioning protein
VTKTWLLRTPPDCDLAVIDTPASLSRADLVSATRGADAILIPVMPSDIDIHAAMKCISDLLLVAKIRRPDRKIGIVANRVRTNTRVYGKLQKFLSSLDIPLIATLRDSQNYIRAFESGLGIHEMPYSQVKKDIEAWEDITAWLQNLREHSRQHPAAIHLLRS